MALEDDSLPPEVQAQVDAARNDEPEQEPEPEHVALPEPKPLSRRAAAEQERNAAIEAANARAEKAERLAEEIRRENGERMARLEAAIEFSTRQQFQQRPEPQQRAEPAGPSLDDTIRKLKKERDKALEEGKISDYHEASEEITRTIARAERQQEAQARQAEMQQFQQRQPQQFQKPAFVTAIESRYPEIMVHHRGLNLVAGYMNILEGDFGPEKLDKAFQRAKEELGLSNGHQKRPDPKIEEKRQLLAGGPTHGAPRSNGGGKPQVKMPAGWRDVAKKAGMSEDEYTRAYVAQHPEDVVRT